MNGPSTGPESRSKEYHCYIRMMHRTLNPAYVGYEIYGGRGIRICALWRGGYGAFLLDVGRAPTPAHSIERIDNMAHYSCGHCDECLAKGWPKNCRWATKTEQANNRRTNVLIEFQGHTKTMQQWAAFLGCSRKKLWKRFKLRESNPERWPLAEVLSPWPPAAALPLSQAA